MSSVVSSGAVPHALLVGRKGSLKSAKPPKVTATTKTVKVKGAKKKR